MLYPGESWFLRSYLIWAAYLKWLFNNHGEKCNRLYKFKGKGLFPHLPLSINHLSKVHYL
jgi:hypothetical protein